MSTWLMARCDSIPSTSTRSTRVTFSKVEFSKFVSLGIFTLRIGVVGSLVGGEVVEDWGGEGWRLTMIAENDFVDECKHFCQTYLFEDTVF